MSERNWLRYKALKHLHVKPSLDWYESNLKTIVQRLKRETSARLALLSLAVIGEAPGHEAFRKVIDYNDAIRRIARDEETAYLPLHERMLDYLREHESERATLPPRLEYRDGLHNTANALGLHSSGLSWDEVSARNGLLLLTDTLHLNSKGANIVADLVEGWLLKNPPPVGEPSA